MRAEEPPSDPFVVLPGSAWGDSLAPVIPPGGDYLEPAQVVHPGSPWTGDTSDDYYALVATAFREAHAPNVRVRVVVSPSFMPEFVVGIRETDGVYFLFKLEATRQLWGYSLMEMFATGEIIAADQEGNNRNQAEIDDLDARLPDNFLEVALDRCEAQLDSRLGEKLIEIWRLMLEQSRAEEPSEMVDGVTYRFEMGERAGEAHSPPIERNAGMFTLIVHRMKDACEAASDFGGAATTNFGPEVDTLLARVGVN